MSLQIITGAINPKLEYLEVIKAPPNYIIVCSVEDDVTYSSNNIQKKLFQFKYRFVYDDNEKSVWSAISKIPFPIQSGSTEFYSQGKVQNCIDLSYFTGDLNVKKIEIAGRVSIDNIWSDFFLIDSINKIESGLGDNEISTYRFKNDSVYLPIDIQESNLLFDYVPDQVNALELANGNTLVVGGIKDGYNKDLPVNPVTDSSSIDAEIINVPFVLQGQVGDLSAVVRNADDTGPFTSKRLNNNEVPGTAGIIKFSGTPVPGDTIIIKLDSFWETILVSSTLLGFPNLETYTTTVQSGWGISDIINAFVNYPSIPDKWLREDPPLIRATKPFNTGDIDDALYIGAYPVGDEDARDFIYNSLTVSIEKGLSFSGQDSVPCYKWLGSYKFGIVYYNRNGKTNGVYTTSSIGTNTDKLSLKTNSFKLNDGDELPEINKALMRINHLPPSWADYYHIVRTKELSCDFSLIVVSCKFERRDNLIYFDIQNLADTAKTYPLSSQVINYSFVKGDRVRIISKFNESNEDADFRDFEILNEEIEDADTENARRFIKVQNIDPFTIGGFDIEDNDKVVIEIYRPAKVISDSSLFFYETGYRFDIVELNGTKYHTSNKISQSSTSPYAEIDLSGDGDYYFKNRAMVVGTDGSETGDIYVVDLNFSEVWPSAVWSQGRPVIVDNDIKEEYFPAMLRFSQSYIYGTNINNLSRFYPNNFEEADASFGDILRLKTRENFIRLFQRYKTGMIPIYRQIIIDNAQSSQVALSERLLNKPNYYSGEYGIDKYGSSLVSTDYGDYFIDTNNKAIVRVSLDGITNISDTNNLSFWANQNIKETSYGYGCFNYENRNVIILVGHLEPNEEDSYDIVNKIVAYSESDKKFESFYGFTDAESIQFINGFIFTGYQGKYYIHDNPVRNNFYGEQQSSSVTTVFNGSLQLKKTYTAIEELSNGLWTGTITTGPLTNQETNLVLGDFQKKIGSYTINSKENKFNATIKRDVNSAGGKFQGDTMKGLYAQLALTNSLTTEQRLISVSLKYIPSPLTNM
jgi:hypothetical protein